MKNELFKILLDKFNVILLFNEKKNKIYNYSVVVCLYYCNITYRSFWLMFFFMKYSCFVFDLFVS